MCNCKWFEIIVAVVVFIFGVWPEILRMTATRWVLGIAAVVLFLHALTCKRLAHCMTDSGMKGASVKKKASKKKASKRRR